MYIGLGFHLYLDYPASFPYFRHNQMGMIYLH
uniref:Uncharacterized protein n=1 Tax=Tetranychus urticae TaxID=32264 RepID=T1KQ26_TETUR